MTTPYGIKMIGNSNGLGLSVRDALANVDAFLKRAELCEETENVAARLRDLVRTCRLSGTRIHDANIAATMLAHGLAILLTENAPDFERLPGLRLLSLNDAARDVLNLCG